jgi:hypothetical protein
VRSKQLFSHRKRWNKEVLFSIVILLHTCTTFCTHTHTHSHTHTHTRTNTLMHTYTHTLHTCVYVCVCEREQSTWPARKKAVGYGSQVEENSQFPLSRKKNMILRWKEGRVWDWRALYVCVCMCMCVWERGREKKEAMNKN